MLAAAPAAAEPLSIIDAARLALERNPDTKIAAARLERARALAGQARSAFFPLARLEASYAVTDNPALAFSQILNQRVFRPDRDFNDVGAVDNLGARATLEFPLFTGLGRFANRDAADHGVDAMRAMATATQDDVALEAAGAWLGVQRARATIAAAEASVAAFDANLGVARRREAAGTLLPQTVLEVEVRLARATEDLGRARSRELVALEALRTVLGLGPDAELEIDDGELGCESGPSCLLSNDGDATVEDQPESVAAKAAAAAAEQGVRAAAAGWWPKVGLSASLGVDRGFLEGGDSVWYVAGAQLSLPVFDGFLTAHRVAEAEAEASRARAEAERLAASLTFERRRAQIALDDARARIEVSARAIELATESRDLARVRFEQGAALATSLVEAETQLLAAQIRNTEARADLDLARLRLRRARGERPIPGLVE